jgi:transcriptional regulator with XRE-family HTH domain
MAERKAKRFPEIGDRLRAYRVATNRSVDDIARRLGVSRAAVYRYEQGEVVKIETIERLGRLLGVPLTALLGVEIEFVSDGQVFFERLRQIEEQALSTVVVYGPVAYVLTSDEYDDVLRDALAETYTEETANAPGRLDTLMACLRRRKQTYRTHRTGIVSISSVPEIERFLATGLVARTGVRSNVSASRRAHAVREVRHMAGLLRRPPMGVQIGIITGGLPVSGFQIVRQREQSRVVTSPFRIGDLPNIRVGVASINDMPHVVQMHEELANELWTKALIGASAADLLDELATTAERRNERTA